MTNICESCQLCSPTAGCTKLAHESCLKEALKNVKPSVTNGEVLMMVFPNWQVDMGYRDEWYQKVVKVDIDPQNAFEDCKRITLDWWNRKWGE